MEKKITLVWRVVQDPDGLYRYEFGKKGEQLEKSDGFREWEEARHVVQNEIELEVDRYKDGFTVEVEELAS